jgi:prophage antirepressor-like protein
LRALIAGVLDVAKDATKAASVGDIKGTLRQMREMTRIAEHEMHEVILSCKRARRDMLVSLPARKPTLH